jgi:hypothetical protein
MSEMSEVPAMLIAIDAAKSQIQSSFLELAGELQKTLLYFTVHLLVRRA